jgi:hypothetical protein
MRIALRSSPRPSCWPAPMRSGRRHAGAGAAVGARVWGTVGVACTMLMWLGGCATRASSSGRPVRAMTASAAPSLSLVAVSCSSSSACTAIGSVTAGSKEESVAERWNGSSWSPQRIPTPPHPDLLRVSCPSLTVCFAAGYATTYAANGDLKQFVPLVDRWAGGSWSRQSTPKVPDPVLDDVSCASPDACTAIGGFGLPGNNGQRPLAERWDGTHWSIQRPPAWADVVSCPSSTGCIAIIGISDRGAPVAERWNGSRWSRQRRPLSNQHDFVVSDLSCSSMSACTAVGFWAACAGGPAACPAHGLAWILDRSRWSVHRVPHAPTDSFENGAGYATVSCVSADWCFGAGSHQLALWNGTRWSIKFKLSRRGETLAGASRTSVSACIAVSDDGKLAEQWNGQTWNRVAPPASS